MASSRVTLAVWLGFKITGKQHVCYLIALLIVVRVQQSAWRRVAILTVLDVTLVVYSPLAELGRALSHIVFATSVVPSIVYALWLVDGVGWRVMMVNERE